MQHRLLHGGHQEAAVGAYLRAKMRALPFELLRRGAGRIGKPERSAVVMGDREAKTLGEESEPANGRWRLERALFLGRWLVRLAVGFFGLHIGDLAGGPGDCTLRTGTHLL